ncbi:protein of unknown function [Hyphomicrobium sp. 1Nfss2.1]
MTNSSYVIATQILKVLEISGQGAHEGSKDLS